MKFSFTAKCPENWKGLQLLALGEEMIGIIFIVVMFLILIFGFELIDWLGKREESA